MPLIIKNYENPKACVLRLHIKKLYGMCKCVFSECNHANSVRNVHSNRFAHASQAKVINKRSIEFNAISCNAVLKCWVKCHMLEEQLYYSVCVQSSNE